MPPYFRFTLFITLQSAQTNEGGLSNVEHLIHKKELATNILHRFPIDFGKFYKTFKPSLLGPVLP